MRASLAPNKNNPARRPLGHLDPPLQLETPEREIRMSASKLPPVTRRRFLANAALTAAAAGSAPIISAPFVSRAMAQNKSLTIVQWSHFVPEYDKWFDNFAKDWGSKNNIAVTVNHIPVANVAARAAAEVSAQSGHDLFG